MCAVCAYHTTFVDYMEHSRSDVEAFFAVETMTCKPERSKKLAKKVGSICQYDQISIRKN